MNVIIRATSSLHLLPLERHERLLGVVEVDEPRPLGRVVEELVVLLDEGLANGLVVGIQRHLGLGWVVGSGGEERRKEEEEAENRHKLNSYTKYRSTFILWKQYM